MTRTYQRPLSLAITLWVVLLFSVAQAEALDPFHQGLEDLNAKRYHAAAQDFQEAVANDPNNQHAYLMLAKIQEILQDREAARSA